MFHVSTAVLHRLQERARPVSVLYGAAALWGYLQSDRQTVVFVCPVSSEWGPTTTSQPTLAPWEVHHPESLPVAFTSRWAAVGLPHGSPALNGLSANVAACYLHQQVGCHRVRIGFTRL